MATYRHLHIRDLGVAPKEFRARPGRSNPKDIPAIADRQAHAVKLRQDLDRAVAGLDAYTREQEKYGVKENQRGIVVAFDGQPDLRLEAGDSSPRSPGIKLLSVRRGVRLRDPVDDEGHHNEPTVEGDSATFFLTPKNIEAIRTNLEKYGEWVDADDKPNPNKKKPRRPNNFWMFETGVAVRPASIIDVWTDSPDKFPRQTGPIEWEVWTRAGFEKSFSAAVEDLDIEINGHSTEFVGVTVRSVIATHEQIQLLINASAAVVGLKGASSFASDFLHSAPEARATQTAEIAERIVQPAASAPRVTVLDTGVQHANPLLMKVLSAKDCHTVNPAWTSADHSGHGTKMAGVIQFFDLEPYGTSKGPIQQYTRLESVVVTAPKSASVIAARDAIERAVKLVEMTPLARVFCLAQTARGETEDGRITTTAAALDRLAYNDGNRARLFCVAAGNVPYSEASPYLVSDYVERNREYGMEAPAQAFNVISVGGSTEKVSGNANLVAPTGDLHPSSRTAEAWPPPHANKPDIVMEAGNFAIDPGGVWARPSGDHMVLTTSKNAPARPMAMTGQTSAATARASGLVGRLMAQYPQYGMEALRGLLIHSAEWTPAMRAQFQSMAATSSQTVALNRMLARYGWGIPNEQRMYLSADNALTMVIEDKLSPFGLGEHGIILKQMKYFRLPWPRDTLRALRGETVNMRCTLSYFVEPDPGAIDRDHFERYASFRLKFDVKRHNETHAQAAARFNEAAEEQAKRGDHGWLLGSQASHRGSLHQDDWSGPAYELANRDGISVAPISGWWADRGDLDNYERSVNFALIVTIKVPQASATLIREAARNAQARVVVEAPVVLEV